MAILNNTDFQEQELIRNIENSLQELTVNLLRLISGTGRSDYLFKQMQECIETVLLYEELTGSTYSTEKLENFLNIFNKAKIDEDNELETLKKRWKKEDQDDLYSMHQRNIAALDIQKFALRVTAARLIGHHLPIKNATNNFDKKIAEFINHDELTTPNRVSHMISKNDIAKFSY